MSKKKINTKSDNFSPDIDDMDRNKLEKIKKKRQQIVNGSISGKIDNIQQRVAYILNNFTPSRNSDIRLTWLYWRTFEKSSFNGNSINEDEMLKLTKMTSISRARAKIQNEYKLFQADDKVKKFRGKLEESKKQEAIDDRPSSPLYTLYIDETGKTQDYLSVGSLWVTNAKEAFFGTGKLNAWKEKREINYEFHFSKLKSHKLRDYKDFFSKFLTFFPSSGFKAIVANRRGHKDIQQAITDLSFHLINKGIDHENTSGRAPLPRKLQVFLDAEEPGSDQLKLENLKERISSQQLEGLLIGDFEVAESSDSIYIQIIDLFVSSINRKLHSSAGNKAKDELANYILKILDFELDNVDIENSDADKAKVFNLSHN